MCKCDEVEVQTEFTRVFGHVLEFSCISRPAATAKGRGPFTVAIVIGRCILYIVVLMCFEVVFWIK